MGLFRKKIPKVDNRTAGSSFAFFLGGSTSGKVVTERSAMQMTAVYSCVRILSEAVAGLPLHFYKYDSNNSKTKAIDDPLYTLLHDEPNPDMTSFIFRETLMTHLLLRILNRCNRFLRYHLFLRSSYSALTDIKRLLRLFHF